MTNVNIRISEDDKKLFNQICDELGLSMSSAFNMFVKSMIRNGGLPFNPRIENFNIDTIRAIQETEDIISGKIKRPIYKTADELFNVLDKED